LPSAAECSEASSAPVPEKSKSASL
jgi:hypothetical protein